MLSKNKKLLISWFGITISIIFIFIGLINIIIFYDYELNKELTNETIKYTSGGSYGYFISGNFIFIISLYSIYKHISKKSWIIICSVYFWNFLIIIIRLNMILNNNCLRSYITCNDEKYEYNLDNYVLNKTLDVLNIIIQLFWIFILLISIYNSSKESCFTILCDTLINFVIYLMSAFLVLLMPIILFIGYLS